MRMSRRARSRACRRSVSTDAVVGSGPSRSDATCIDLDLLQAPPPSGERTATPARLLNQIEGVGQRQIVSQLDVSEVPELQDRCSSLAGILTGRGGPRCGLTPAFGAPRRGRW